MMRVFAGSVILVLAALVAGCGTATQTALPSDAPTQAPTDIPTSTATSPAVPTATVSPTVTRTPKPTPEPPPFFGLLPAGTEPVVARGGGSDWDGRYINPGAMLYHNGMFHMFRNGFQNWPGLIGVGYATSPDGLTWTEAQEEPVFWSRDVPYIRETSGSDVSSIVIVDGTWVMYFHTVGGGQSVIGRASSPAPTGPWTVDPEPVLEPGDSGAWDERHVTWPSVHLTEDGYLMFYGGRSNDRREAIGAATSSDGINWQKLPEPVLKPQGRWGGETINRPEVQFDGEQWVMIYQGGLQLTDRGLAFSKDGVTWRPDSGNPIITSAYMPEDGTVWDTALLFVDDTHYYFMEIGSTVGTDIYLMAHEGSLTP